MLKYIGLSKDGQDFVGGYTKDFNGMVRIGEGRAAYMKTWRRNLLDPNTLVNTMTTIIEHPDQYVKVGDDYYLFTSLQVLYPSRTQNAFEWSNNWNNGWFDTMKGQLWPPRNAEILPLPTPTGAVLTVENGWIPGSQSQWLSEQTASQSIEKLKQLHIPNVPEVIKLGRYRVPMVNMMNMDELVDVVVEETVDRILRNDGLYIVLLKLVFTDMNVMQPAFTGWTSGYVMDNYCDRSTGQYDAMKLEEVTFDPTWIEDIPQ